MEKLEEVMATWSRQIEQVLVESEQIRREADNIGPLAELNYWKSRMAKFNTCVPAIHTPAFYSSVIPLVGCVAVDLIHDSHLFETASIAYRTL